MNLILKANQKGGIDMKKYIVAVIKVAFLSYKTFRIELVIVEYCGNRVKN